MKGLNKYNLNDTDKSGFPINKNGQHISIQDADGNRIIFIHNYLLEQYPEGLGVKFNPNIALEVNKALDTLVDILTKNFDKHIKGEWSIDLSNEVKAERGFCTKEPLIVPTVQIYFARIENYLNYLGNCYDVNFKVRFYVKFKNRVKQHLLPLETNLNNNYIKKSYLKYCRKWIKETDKAIQLEQDAKNNVVNKSKELTQEKNIIAYELLGENKVNAESVIYHHIEQVLRKHEISHSDARQILLDMKGTFSPPRIEKIVEPIILYLERSSGISQPHLNNKYDENNSFIFENNFDQVEPNEVYKYFFDSLVKTKYIDERTLKSYLTLAFQDLREPQQKFIINNKSTNKKVQQVFYNYYKDIAGKPYGKQPNYIKLLGNYFVGFNTEKLKTNFSKTY